MNGPTDSDGVEARSALRVLYAAAAAQLRAEDVDADVDIAALLADAVTVTDVEDLLIAGVMSVAEQLRDIATWRRMDPCRLLRVLRAAHLELAGPQSALADLLTLSGEYLAGGIAVIDAQKVTALLYPAPQPALLGTVELLAAALRWRAQDQKVPAHELVRRICLGLAVRDAALQP